MKNVSSSNGKKFYKNFKCFSLSHFSKILYHSLSLRLFPQSTVCKTHLLNFVPQINDTCICDLKGEIKEMGNFSSRRDVDMSGPVAEFVKATIASDKIVIFSKSYCPYCRIAKEVSHYMINN